jgi:hypothetical protein
MEHSEVGPWSMAVKPQSGVGFCITGQILCGDGVAETACETGLVNRTAVVRDPYARWCGRGEAVRPLPIPISNEKQGYESL